MIQNFNYLFQYLEKENISFDKNEFEFQIHSHPDYPSLLAIADTLSFFKVDNLSVRIKKDEIDVLPALFIAFLNEEFNTPSLFLVEKRGDNYLILKDKITITISHHELQQRWLEIVLLVEKLEIETIKIDKKNFNSLFLTLLILTFGSVLYSLNATTKEILFLLLPTIGILFSIAALKDLFNAKSELINSFCNITASTNCVSVVNSSKWKIFELVNFSDLSIVFFASQFLGVLVFMFSGNANTYFAIQQILLLSAIPVIFLSIYYQKFVEKKWCPICLVIIGIILLELGYSYVFYNDYFSIPLKEIIIFGFVFLSILLAWSNLKKLLTNHKELKEFQLKSLRFERNYTVFKNSLLAKEKAQLPQSSIILGNKESNTVITIISNPFCGHCKEAHEVIETILEKHHNDIQLQVILKTNLEAENEEGKKMFRSLIGIYKQDGATIFIKALKAWFDNKNIEDWFGLFPIKATTVFDATFKNQYKWCEENDYNFTPTIFVNGYEYPQIFDRKNLEFYINELVEDSF